MSKILFFSDIHVHSHKASLSRLQHCLDVLKWTFEVAIERNIKDVVFLGDLFQDREKILVLPYQRTYQILEKYCGNPDGIRLHLLIGNHDMWYANKTDISSVYPFGSIHGVNIISKCCTLEIGGLNMDFLPFTLNPLESLENFITSQSRILCGHIALDGAQFNTFYKTQADISVEYDGDMVKVDANAFAPWEKVFLGHYHGAQNIQHIEYIGSPLQLNFAEAFQEKHLLILDSETLKQEYVVNDFSPKHLILKEDELNKYDLNNAFVKMIAKDIGSSDLVDIRKELTDKYNILDLEFSAPKAEEDDETKITIENAQNIMVQNTTEMLRHYMEAVGIPKTLDFNKLLHIGEMECQKSQIQ